MTNYSKGVIYTIRYRNDSSLIYVGSTIQPLSKRWYEHKINCFNEKSNGYNMNLYKKIRETNDLENWFIELYENFPCSSKQELNKREGEVIREIGNLNSNIAGRSIKESNKEYREENKEKLNQKAKEYRKENKDKIKEKAKEKYEKDKDLILEKRKEYYLNNKEKIIKKHKEEFICDCGSCVRISDKSIHFKSKKHQNYLLNNPPTL